LRASERGSGDKQTENNCKARNAFGTPLHSSSPEKLGGNNQERTKIKRDGTTAVAAASAYTRRAKHVRKLCAAQA
jgi:hypothetical protein